MISTLLKDTSKNMRRFTVIDLPYILRFLVKAGVGNSSLHPQCSTLFGEALGLASSSALRYFSLLALIETGVSSAYYCKELNEAITNSAKQTILTNSPHIPRLVQIIEILTNLKNVGFADEVMLMAVEALEFSFVQCPSTFASEGNKKGIDTLKKYAQPTVLEAIRNWESANSWILHDRRIQPPQDILLSKPL